MGDVLDIQCPSCHVRLRVPVEYLNKRARCKACGHVFVIKPPSLEDSIMEWLAEADEFEDASASKAGETMYVPPPPRPQAPAVSAPPRRQAAVTPSVTAKMPLRLSHVDTLGAFFLFPPSLLEDPEFRSSMPRCCLSCGVTHSLKLHLVIWSSKLADRDRTKFRVPALQGNIRTEDLVRMSGTKLLGALPRVPNMPSPFDLPMPYFICNRCSPVGAVMTHVRTSPTGQQECELGIASLRRAAEFFAHSLGRDHPDYACLAREIKRRKGDPWKALPLSVRNRLEHWLQLESGEKFICYIRDLDFAKGEAGMGGVAMTDRRIVYHKYAAQREIRLTERIELRAENTHDHYLLRIGRPGERPFVLHCEPSSTEIIRQTLRRAGAKYTYKT